ncbi:MAG: hypothetical protein AB1465_04210 [Patescibacteria group bacterium]
MEIVLLTLEGKMCDKSPEVRELESKKDNNETVKEEERPVKSVHSLSPYVSVCGVFPNFNAYLAFLGSTGFYK